MNKWLYILIMHCALFVVNPIMAEVVILHSGKVLNGQITMQNEEIVMLQDAEGRRYQLLRTDISEIRAEQPIVEKNAVIEDTNNNGKVALRLDMSGTSVFVPTNGTGGGASVDLQIGTRQLAGRSIFLGGSVGYQFSTYLFPNSPIHYPNHFLPLAVVVSVPLMEGKHAPELGAALGYAFALKQPIEGGIHARLDCSWRYQYSETSALLLGVQVRFQQARVRSSETIEEKEYISQLGQNIVSVGLRLALVF